MSCYFKYVLYFEPCIWYLSVLYPGSVFHIFPMSNISNISYVLCPVYIFPMSCVLYIHFLCPVSCVLYINVSYVLCLVFNICPIYSLSNILYISYFLCPVFNICPIHPMSNIRNISCVLYSMYVVYVLCPIF